MIFFIITIVLAVIAGTISTVFTDGYGRIPDRMAESRLVRESVARHPSRDFRAS